MDYYKLQHDGRKVQLSPSDMPDEDPTTYRKLEAVESWHSKKWTWAMKDEINALKKNKSFEVLDKPIGRNIVGSKWVFKTKRNADSTLERY